MTQVPNWYVITGGPASGKSSLLAELSKIGHQTVPEAARTVIDQARAAGITPEQLRADEQSFQDKVMRFKVRLEAEISEDSLTFFDRGMQDTLAYMRYYSYKVEDWVSQLMGKARYKAVFLLEPLPTYQKDYARTETDEGFVDKIHQLLHKAYSEFGMKPILVPPVSLAERLTFVLDHVNQEPTA